MLLLTTRGRRSGKVRTIPLLYVDDAGDYVLIASNGGAELHPAWYLNLQAEPDCTVELRGAKRRVHASDVTDPDDRARLWKLANEGYGSYDGYATKTDRTIPVVRLHPTSWRPVAHPACRAARALCPTTRGRCRVARSVRLPRVLIVGV